MSDVRPTLPVQNLQIRTLRDTDLDAAEVLLQRAFARPANRRLELERGLRLQPETWFLAEADENVVGMVGAMVYDRFSWIGLMAVDPGRQSCGIGRALMERVLGELDRRNSPMVLLDASEAGFSLYRSLGFVEEDEAQMFEGSPSGHVCEKNPRIIPMTAALLPEIVKFDTPIFGANRKTVLEAYLQEFPTRSFALLGNSNDICGFAIAQGRRIGPWVASSPQDAKLLLQRLLGLEFPELPQVIVAGKCRESSDMLRGYGFQPRNANRHMRRGGTGLTGNRSLMFGQGSFATG